VYSFSLPTSCDPQCIPAYVPITYTTGTTDPKPPAPTGGAGGTPTGTCTATARTVDSWPGGVQEQVTVTADTTAIRSWTVGWTLTPDEALGDAPGSTWNGAFTNTGGVISVSNLGYNGAVPAGKSTTFGFTLTGTPTTPTLTCVAG
jgi:hypothetical protein